MGQLRLRGDKYLVVKKKFIASRRDAVQGVGRLSADLGTVFRGFWGVWDMGLVGIGLFGIRDFRG